MPTTYSPSPVALPASIPEMVDGDPRTAASVTQITRPLADAIKYLMGQGLQAQIFTFTASGNLVVPANATPIIFWGGYGSGGGGGGGARGTADTSGTGGGGGGQGAEYMDGFSAITPGVTYPVTTGTAVTGGAGGSGGSGAGSGGNGGNESLIGTAGAVAKMPGGYGGRGGQINSLVASTHRAAYGGSTRPNAWADYIDIIAATMGFLTLEPRQGGFGMPINTGGSPLLIGVGGPYREFFGGGPGTPGTDEGGAAPPGGGPGGGGGAGPGGNGAVGGNGGKSGTGGTATSDPGGAGGNAGANTGAGGAGGGAGGSSTDDGNEVGGNGGSSGSGKVQCMIFVPIA